MRSPVCRLWFVLCSSVALWVTGCVANNTDCGGPTSDWPFCRGGGADRLPNLSGGGAAPEQGDLSGGSSEDAGAGPDTFTPTAGGGDAGSSGGGNEGSAPPTGAEGDVCLLCDGVDGSSGLLGVEFTAEGGGCGLPLPCAWEVALDGGDQKSLEGTAPLDFTHGSVTWQSNVPGYVDVYLRAQDAEGDEVRIGLRFAESDLQDAAGSAVAARVVQGIDCGEGPFQGLQASLTLAGLGWNAGFQGLITLEGDGWMAEIDLAAPAVCWPE